MVSTCDGSMIVYMYVVGMSVQDIKDSAQSNFLVKIRSPVALLIIYKPSYSILLLPKLGTKSFNLSSMFLPCLKNVACHLQPTVGKLMIYK